VRATVPVLAVETVEAL